MKILCVGPIWRGSNAGGLFKALSRQGALIEIVDDFYHVPLSANLLIPKIIAKIFRNFFVKDYNAQIINQVNRFSPDIVFVYKGAFVKPQTLLALKLKGIKLFNFYPDVSFHTHGNLLPKTLGLYDQIFTTKTFGIQDLKNQLNFSNAIFIPHGFDPEIHKPIPKELIPQDFFCDISFIGTYSPKKEKILAAIAQKFPEYNLKIWGTQWEKSTELSLKKSLQHEPIFGDLYAAGICASKINLGILNEQVKGASSGDLITSRTFHIPAAGGFMMHEKNEESTLYFEENKEAIFFDGISDLLEKIPLYIENTSLRNKIALDGHQRALRDHVLDRRAELVLNSMQQVLSLTAK